MRSRGGDARRKLWLGEDSREKIKKRRKERVEGRIGR